MEAHRPEPEESWQDRQFDKQHRQAPEYKQAMSKTAEEIPSSYGYKISSADGSEEETIYTKEDMKAYAKQEVEKVMEMTVKIIDAVKVEPTMGGSVVGFVDRKKMGKAINEYWALYHAPSSPPMNRRRRIVILTCGQLEKRFCWMPCGRRQGNIEGEVREIEKVILNKKK